MEPRPAVPISYPSHMTHVAVFLVMLATVCLVRPLDGAWKTRPGVEKRLIAKVRDEKKRITLE